MGRIYVDGANGRVERTDLYLVSLLMNDGRVIENLEPRRLFPISDKDKYVTLIDGTEKEVAIIRDMASLDIQSRQALEQCFREYYLIPRITQVLDITDKSGALTFRVMTDRGEISFRIRNRHSDIKTLGKSGRIVIRDSDDNRYEIIDYDALDRRSKSFMFSYV